MSKRTFRDRPAPTAAPQAPAYPTLSDFDQTSRRDALRRLGALGAALFGAGSLLAACGDRKVGATPDAHLMAGIAQQPDGGPPPPEPDLTHMAGVAPEPDSGLDQRHPDIGLLEGDVAGPDARVDEPDAHLLAGAPEQPDGGKP